MQALAERLDAEIAGSALEAVEPLGFSALKTVMPSPDSFIGATLEHVGRYAKYLILEFGEAGRIMIHLSQAGRLDVEEPPKRTRAKGSVVRLRFSNGKATLVREYGHERKAAWWVLAPGDDGPLATLGPEPDSDEFAELILYGDDRRRVHTLLHDQHTIAGVGRGYADDALWRAPAVALCVASVTRRRRTRAIARSGSRCACERPRARTWADWWPVTAETR